MKTQAILSRILLVLLLSQTTIYAQKSPDKFGKIAPTDLETTVCPIDSNAHAFFIFDCGVTNFEYNTAVEGKGFQLYFERHLRIKIIDNQGFSWSNIQIPLYKSGSNKEEVSSLKAFTYNLNDGKVEKTKLDQNDILTEETGENWQTMKFAMPNVKEGSVIEVKYTIISDFLFNLQEWQFQKSIPVLYSEYLVSIPEYFQYNQTQFGYTPIQLETNSRRNKITFTSTERTNTYVVKTVRHTSEVEYDEQIYHYHASNVLPIPDEQFLRTKENYLTKVDFELQFTKFPNQAMDYYTTSWEEVDKTLINSERFGKALSRTNHLKDDVAYLTSLGLQNEDLLNAALHQIQKTIHWNGYRDKYLSSTLNSAYKDGEGNSADVNLNLVVLLRELGLKSSPVVLSTQDNGIIHPAHPSLSRFNYVIATVQLNDNTYLLDATDPNSRLNLIPIRCLNDKGRVIGEYPEKWISLMDYKPYALTANYLVSIDSALSISGSVNKKLSEYGAFDYKSKLNEANDVSDFLTDLEETSTGFEIENMSIKGHEDVNEHLNYRYKMSHNNILSGSGSMIYFSPILDPFFKENPFKLEKREFPVEFDYPYIFQNTYTYLIPANLEVAELPKSIVFKLPDNHGSFYFQVESTGKTLSVSSKIQLNKSVFLPSEYEVLKSFFQYVVDKQNELVILKTI